MRLASLLLLGACCSAPAPITKVVVQTVREPCLQAPPPVLTPVPAPKVCAPDTLCFAKTDASALAENVELLEGWAATWWERCRAPAASP